MTMEIIIILQIWLHDRADQFKKKSQTLENKARVIKTKIHAELQYKTRNI